MNIVQSYEQLKNQAKTLLLAQEYQKSLEAYLQIISILQQITNLSKKDQAIIYLNTGICYFNLEKLEESERYVNKAIEIDSAYAKAHYRKILILQKQEKYIEAFQLCIKLNSFEPCTEVQQLLVTLQKQAKTQFYNLDWDKDFKEQLNQGQINNEAILKEYFGLIQSKFTSIEIYQEGIEKGFFTNMLQHFIKLKASVSSMLYPFNLLKIMGKELEDQTSSHCYYFNNKISAEIMQFLEKSLNLSTYQEQLTKKDLSETVISLLKLLYYVRLPSCLEYIFKNIMEIQSVLDLSKWIHILLSKFIQYQKKFFELSKQYDQQPSEEILHKLIDNQVESILNLYKDEQAKEEDKGQKVRHRLDIIQNIYYILQMMIENYVRKQNYYKKDKLNKRDLVQAYCLLASKYEENIRVFIDHKVWIALFTTFMNKKRSLIHLDFILRLCDFLLKNEEIQKNIEENSSEYIQQVNVELQDFLHGYLQVEKNESLKIKYTLLLFRLNFKKKVFELHTFLKYFNYSLIKPNDEWNLELLEVFSYLSCFDKIKIEMVEKQDILITLIQAIERQQELWNKYENYNCHLNVISICCNLVTDQIREQEEAQKQKYELDDEKFESMKQLQKKCQNEDYQLQKQIFQYNENYIKEKNVREFVCNKIKVQNYIEYLYINFKDQIKSSLLCSSIGKLLNNLVQESTVVPVLIKKQILRFACDIYEKQFFEIGGFIAKVYSNINPQILDYCDVNRSIDVLFQIIDKEKVKEIVIFESALGVIQLSSLGEYAISNVIDFKHIMTIQNMLFEENDYIVHAALEILNNFLIYEKAISLIEKGKYDNLFKILSAHFINFLDKVKENKSTSQIAENAYNNPEKVLCTIYSIMAVTLAIQENYKEYVLNIVNLEKLLAIFQEIKFWPRKLDIGFKYVFIAKNSKITEIKQQFEENQKNIKWQIYQSIIKVQPEEKYISLVENEHLKFLQEFVNQK